MTAEPTSNLKEKLLNPLLVEHSGLRLSEGENMRSYIRRELITFGIFLDFISSSKTKDYGIIPLTLNKKYSSDTVRYLSPWSVDFNFKRDFAELFVLDQAIYFEGSNKRPDPKTFEKAFIPFSENELTLTNLRVNFHHVYTRLYPVHVSSRIDTT